MTIGIAIRRAGVLAASAALLAASVTMGAPAQAADNGAWAATPCQEGRFTPRQFFFFEAAGGQTIRDCVTISNAGEDDLVLDLYPADAFNVETGAGFGVRERADDNTDVGSWIEIETDQVTIPGEGAVDVEFVLRVPEGATPGDHAGAVVTVEPEPSGPGVDGGSSQVAIQRALGVRTYVRVDGPLTPVLTIERVSLEVRPARLPWIGGQGGARVTYTVRNDGNVRLTPDRVIELKGFFGRTLHSTTSTPLPEILPGARVTLSQEFSGMPVFDRVTASVTLSEGTTGVETSGDATRWSISVGFLIVVLALIVVVGLMLRRRRQRSLQARDSAEPVDSPEIAAQ